MFCWNAVARAASICACAWRNDSRSPRERTDGKTSGSVSRPSRSRMPGVPGVPVGGVTGGAGVIFRVVSRGSCARADGRGEQQQHDRCRKRCNASSALGRERGTRCLRVAYPRAHGIFHSVKILHRYVLKEHVGPLTFALTALTSILLLQYIGKHFGELVGKGLPTLVIAEFFGLSVPLTVALTLPMAVLVATLYAFSRLAAENEITALKASGVSLVSVLKPVLWAALGVTVVMIGFNDQVLPRSNHRLAVLQRDIAQKKPTFGLREQVINEVSPGKFYLRAGHLDEASNLMREVTIYDMADPTRRRTIYADSGNMGMSKGLTDLELTLYNGNTQDVPTANPDELQRLYFNVDLIRVRGVGNQFQKTTADSYKSDREMTVCEMQAAQDRARREHEQVRKEYLAKRAALVKSKAMLSKGSTNADTSLPWDVGLGRLYCGALSLFVPKKAHAQTVSSTPKANGASGAAQQVAPPRQAPPRETRRAARRPPGQA